MTTPAHIAKGTQSDWGRPLAPRFRSRWLLMLAFGLVLHVPRAAQAQATPSQVGPASDSGQPLDSVIAVVTNQVILSSDLDLETRIFQLLPIGRRGDYTPAKALERLITRALIEQQILQEDPQGLEISPKDLEDSLTELRQNLPGCKHTDCSTAAGWEAYLTTLGLTPARVSEYWEHRMAVLRFIEMRFRSGIRITPEEIQTYYKETLVPKYPSPEDAPQLEKISPRIQEVLLQQKVNVLLNDWLKSLQDQGQVEILDPLLRAQVGSAAGGEGPGVHPPGARGADAPGTAIPASPPPQQSAPPSNPAPQKSPPQGASPQGSSPQGSSPLIGGRA